MRKHLKFAIVLIGIMCLLPGVFARSISSTDTAVIGNNDWSITSDGDFVPNANTYSIGTSSYYPDQICLAGACKSSWGPIVSVTDASEYDVTVANSGKTHLITDLSQNTSIDLPTEASGLYYRFIYVGGSDEAHDHTIDAENDTNYFIGGVAFADTDAGDGSDEINAGVYSDGDSNSKLTLNNSSAGTVVEVYCDGTNWYVSGRVFADAVPAFADQ